MYLLQPGLQSTIVAQTVVLQSGCENDVLFYIGEERDQEAVAVGHGNFFAI